MDSSSVIHLNDASGENLDRRAGRVEPRRSLMTTPARRIKIRLSPGMTNDLEPESTFSLLERARAGDRHAIRATRRAAPRAAAAVGVGRLPRWARGMVETQDLVQETLFQTFRKIETFRPRTRGRAQAYLRQAVLNKIRGPNRGEWAAARDRCALTVNTSILDRRRSKKRLAERRRSAMKPHSPRSGRRNGKRSSAASSWDTHVSELAEALGKPTGDAARKAAEARALGDSSRR